MKRLSVKKNQHGAVALLCLASFLILSMLSFIIFDTGTALRAKVDAKQGADTAAYSAASVQARGMNMIAFANVGKRTIMGIHNMYYFQQLFYFLWWVGQCSRCCCGWYCGCWSECFNCWGNLASLDPILEWIDFARFLSNDDLEENLEELDEFQEDMKNYARYWATGEGMTRGVRNRADLVGMYPTPDEATYGPLPLEDGNPSESCLAPGPWAPMTAGSVAEFYSNFAELQDRSTSSPNIASEGPAEIVSFVWAYLGCLASSGKDEAKHIALRADSNSSEHLFAKSTAVYSYVHEPKLFGQHRNNYNFMSREYADDARGVGQVRPAAGVWAMARSEIYQPADARPGTFIFDGPHSNWMFHPGWIGKNRPLMFIQELTPNGHDVDTWVSASIGTAQTMATGTFLMPSVPGYDAAGFAQDVVYMRNNVSPDMTGVDDAAERYHLLYGSD